MNFLATHTFARALVNVMHAANIIVDYDMEDIKESADIIVDIDTEELEESEMNGVLMDSFEMISYRIWHSYSVNLSSGPLSASSLAMADVPRPVLASCAPPPARPGVASSELPPTPALPSLLPPALLGDKKSLYCASISD